MFCFVLFRINHNHIKVSPGLPVRNVYDIDMYSAQCNQSTKA